MNKSTLKKELDSVNQDLAYNLAKFQAAQTYEAAKKLQAAVQYAFLKGLPVICTPETVQS